MIEIKSCPFCGEEAGIYAGTDGIAVMCRKCFAKTKSVSDSSLANYSKFPAVSLVVDDWNKRPRAEAIPPSEYEDAFYCGNCDEPINKGDKFCHECGKQVKWE